MPNFLALTSQGPGQLTLAPAPLGRGGEGSVYEVTGHSLPSLPPAGQLVAKLYHEPQEGDRLNKIRAMVTAPPASTAVAWPLAVVFKQDKTFAGYLMLKLGNESYRPWAELAHAKTRRETASSFDVRYGLTAIRNLAVALASVHSAGHRVGDINESNIFVGGDARVFLVDTDSAQVQGASGAVYPCLVGKPEYTAPELSHGPLKDQLRTEASDIFGFAVAAYQMLTGGAHPTDGIFEGEGDPSSVVHRIRGGEYPGLNPASTRALRHPARIPTAAMPAGVRLALLQALAPDPNGRPSLAMLAGALDAALAQLQQCPRVRHHWFDVRDGGCGWCAHVAQGQPDPWSDRAASEQALPQQAALPPVAFGSGSQAPAPVRRAAPARAGSPASHAPGSPPPSPGAASYPPPGGSPYPPPASASPPPPPQQQGRKTMLTYADGSTRSRPPLGLLLRENPGLALRCIRKETPDLAQFWWPASRDLAQPLFLALGMTLAAGLACLWVLMLPRLLAPVGEAWAVPLWQLGALAAGVGTTFTAVWLTFSGLWDRRRAKKAAGSLDKFKPEAGSKTVARYAAISVLYGPLLVAGLLGGAVALALNFLLNMLKSTSGPSYR